MNRNFFSIGLMSGTSMDGIDVSIIKSNGEEFVQIIDNIYIKYTKQFKKRLKNINKLCTSKEELNRLSKKINKLEEEITIQNGKACKLILSRNKKIKINLIGFHGQTILHKPKEGYSIQLGNPYLLSKLTKTTVVSKFRDNDILNGGQGAPLTPLYHKLILKNIKVNLPSAIINIGGISNITYIDKYNKIYSFDSGPGNYLIDMWVNIKKKLEFDDKGLIAKAGKCDQKILKKLLRDPYYKKKYTKSLDVKYFKLDYLKKLSLEDGAATLSMLTVDSICSSLNYFNKKPKVVIISGGGRKNKFITDNIKKKMKSKILLIDKFNLNGDFIESQAFAYLAIRSFLKKNITYPSTTGVKKAVSGGLIYKN